MKKLLFVVGATLTTGAALAQLSFDNSIVGTFTDISATGTALNLADDDEANFTSTVGNALLAAGDVREATTAVSLSAPPMAISDSRTLRFRAPAVLRVSLQIPYRPTHRYCSLIGTTCSPPQETFTGRKSAAH
ncbi:MAG: hypothetical protein M3R13_02330 [Armatimonadota bacterium]|nr:hypothetical protein [Armatimonadota bacterium]